MVYVGATTPLKQKETYGLCVPSFMLSCLLDTLLQMENEHSTSQDVRGMARIQHAQLYVRGSHSFMASHRCRISNLGVGGCTLSRYNFYSPLYTMAHCVQR